MTKQTQAAVLERDAEKRAEMYQAIQREHQQVSPFIIMFQQIGGGRPCARTSTAS